MIWEDNEQISGFFLPDHGKFAGGRNVRGGWEEAAAAAD
jgi:hypothetical protein